MSTKLHSLMVGTSSKKPPMNLVKMLPVNMSPLEHQQYQRLRVNRIAVMQELNVSHVLESLMKHSVIDQDDLDYIISGETSFEQSKRLLDVLPTKGKSSNWYRHFRAALLDPLSDDSKVRQRYQVLVEFLDNTIVEQMRHQIRVKKTVPSESHKIAENDTAAGLFSKYKPLPNINNDTRPKPKSRVTTVDTTSLSRDRRSLSQSGYHNDSMEDIYDEIDCFPIDVVYLQWKTTESLNPTYESSIQMLEKSSHELDRTLAKQERAVLYRYTQAEITCQQWLVQELVEDDMVFCTCSPILDVVFDTTSYPLYYKYIQHAKKNGSCDIIYELICSFDELTQWLVNEEQESTRQNIVKLGLAITDFLMQVNEDEALEQVVHSLLSFLADNKTLDTLIPLFKVYSKFMALTNRRLTFGATNHLYSKVMAVKEQIELVSFGQDVLFCSEMYVQTSLMMQMLNDYGRGYTLAQRALQEVDPADKESTVEALIVGSCAYTNQFKLMRAEALAIEAVQQAKQHFTVYNAVYLKALLCFVNFAAEYRKDSFTLESSDAALNIAMKLYNADCLQIAEALRCKALALLSTGKTEDGLHFTLAQRAHNMAMTVLPVNHPRLLPFIAILVKALTSRYVDVTDLGAKQEFLIWVEGECDRMLKMSQRHFGDASLKTVEAYNLIGQLNFIVGRYEKAEEAYAAALNRATKCLSPKHGLVFRLRAEMAKVNVATETYKSVLEPLREVVDKFDTGSYYLDWYNGAFDSLVKVLAELGFSDEVNDYKSKHLGWKWTSEDNQRQINWRLLHTPPEAFEAFLQKFDVWSKVKKIQDQLDKVKMDNSKSKLDAK